MRKTHSPHGNVGPTKHDTGLGSSKKRCNVCDYFNGSSGAPRAMHKDPEDITGGYVCEQCKKFPLGESKDFEEEDWYDNAIWNSRHTVDGEKNYDEMVEDLITDYEKSEGR